jgi:hypothetical protein
MEVEGQVTCTILLGGGASLLGEENIIENARVGDERKFRVPVRERETRDTRLGLATATAIFVDFTKTVSFWCLMLSTQTTPFWC